MSVHPLASVDPAARLADGVTVGPFAVIEAGAVAGEGCEIRAHAVLKPHARLGRGVVVHEGAVIGGDPQDLTFQPCESTAEIGDGSVLREGVTIHRGSKPGSATRVGRGCYLMAYVHVAHDDVLGDGVIAANNAALAGHVHVGDKAFVSGGVVIHQFCRVGRQAMVAGNAKLVQDALPFSILDGVPARWRGINAIGLRRAGFSAGELREVRESYRLLLRAGLGREAALREVDALGGALSAEIAAFVRGGKRGFAHRRGSGAAGE